MKQLIRQTQLNDPVYLTGFILFFLSLVIFLLSGNDFFGRGVNPIIFFANYGIFVVYLIVTIVKKRKLPKAARYERDSYNILLLLLANISAYSLNREIPVFHESTEWLSVFLTLLSAGLLLFSLRPVYRSAVLSYGLVFLFAAGLLFNIYEAILMLPVYPIGFVGFWVLGIPMHVFVPIWFCIQLFFMLRRFVQASPSFKHSLLAGIGLPLAMLVVFSAYWNRLDHLIDEAYQAQTSPLSDHQLPPWVRVSQELPDNWVTERILKAGMVYSAPNVDNLFDFGDIPRLNQRVTHDPLVSVATLVNGKLDLSVDERVKLLRAVFNQRHQTRDRLWSGNHLRTSDLITNVQLIPEERLAYTEKIFRIENTNAASWTRPEEALYTFYLPEGSVVTSASLWIEGEERPALLTTKSKADSAYRTIVGVESRDPLLIHWQEGNQLNVRVFPCTPEDERQFKIGITSPLQFKEGELTYQNIDFNGPDYQQTPETIQLIGRNALPEIDSDLRFRAEGKGYLYSGRYQSDWQLWMKAPPLSDAVFRFNEQSYRLANARIGNESFEARRIYLDINESWSGRTFKKIWKQIGDREVYVYNEGLIKLTEENHRRLFRTLNDRSYTLFPFHLVEPEGALVISGSTGLTPLLEDLEETPFAKAMDRQLAGRQQMLRVFHLGADWSPYLQSLKQLRVIQGESGGPDDLAILLREGHFPDWPENGQRVYLPEAGITIEQVPERASGAASDHLLRMFAYNDILRQVGPQYFSRDYLEEELLSMAQEAHIVSPVSSLIVLETQEDYDRFGIEASQNSLGNATMENNGAVPEPGEWVMIILCVGMGVWLWMRRRGTSFDIVFVKRKN